MPLSIMTDSVTKPPLACGTLQRLSVGIVAVWSMLLSPLSLADTFQTAEQCQQSADEMHQKCHALYERFLSCKGTDKEVIHCRSQVDPEPCWADEQALSSLCAQMRLRERERSRSEQQTLELNAQQKAELEIQQRQWRVERNPIVISRNPAGEVTQNDVSRRDSHQPTIEGKVNNVKRLFDLVVKGVDPDPDPDDTPVTSKVFETSSHLKDELQDKAMPGESGQAAKSVQDRALILLKREMREVEQQANRARELADSVSGKSAAVASPVQTPASPLSGPGPVSSDVIRSGVGKPQQNLETNPWQASVASTTHTVSNSSSPIDSANPWLAQGDIDETNEAAHQNRTTECRERQRKARFRWQEAGRLCYSPIGVKSAPVICCS